MNFLQRQENNGKYYSRAMNDNHSGTVIKAEDTK
jgi:hypothetical protein